MRYLKHIKIILSISLIVVCIGCNDMDKIHEQYLGGEIIYSGKLDTLLVRPGMYRAQLEGYTHLLGNSNKVIIEFDNRTEVFDIDNNVSEIYSVIIENHLIVCFSKINWWEWMRWRGHWRQGEGGRSGKCIGWRRARSESSRNQVV